VFRSSLFFLSGITELDEDARRACQPSPDNSSSSVKLSSSIVPACDSYLSSCLRRFSSDNAANKSGGRSFMESRNPKIGKVEKGIAMAGEMREADLAEPSARIDESKGGITLTEALAKLPGPRGARFASVFERGSLLIEIYAPRGRDPQQPHTRDEAYIVMQGNGEFVNGGQRHAFGPGDFLFVPLASSIASRISRTISSLGSSSTAPKAAKT
jgi:mannose-6-phosphate isomerase-like protein (cupin superfamily)